MARWCRGGCRKRVTQRGKYLCAKCSKSKIAGGEKKDGDLVYGLYDHTGSLVYVGVTNSAKTRVSQHAGLKKFQKMKIIRRFDSRAEANSFEIYAIWNLRPPLNKKIDEPWSNKWTEEDLTPFGAVARSAGLTCEVCDTVLSEYNSGTTCRVHTQRRSPSAKRRRK